MMDRFTVTDPHYPFMVSIDARLAVVPTICSTFRIKVVSVLSYKMEQKDGGVGDCIAEATIIKVTTMDATASFKKLKFIVKGFNMV